LEEGTGGIDDDFGPDFKDQVRSVQPPAAPASNRPTANNNNNDRLPDFKDQVRMVQPPAAAQDNPGNPAATDAFKQGEEEDSSVVMQQHQEPHAALGGNDQDPSVTPFAEGIPIDGDTQALDGGGGDEALVAAAAGGGGSDGVAVTPQTTVLRKHIVWAIAFVVLGTVVAVVVALTNSSSGDSDSGPTPSTGVVNPSPVPPPTLAATQPMAAAAPTVAPTVVSSNLPNTEAPTAPAPMG